MSKRKKKRSIMDIATTIILIVCAIGFVGMVVSIVYTKNKDKNDSTQTAQATATATGSAATEEPKVDEKYITRYGCVISDGTQSDESGSAFYLELNEKDKTYKRLLNAGKESSELSRGTFTRTKEGIETVDKDNNKDLFYFEGDYLISRQALYQGKVPDQTTFNKTFVNEVEGDNKVKIQFKKNGKFVQSIVRYKANLDGSDTDNAAAGTYKRKGKFIYRTKDDGSKMMPLYIYKDRMCTSYYKLEKKATATE